MLFSSFNYTTSFDCLYHWWIGRRGNHQSPLFTHFGKNTQIWEHVPYKVTFQWIKRNVFSIDEVPSMEKTWRGECVSSAHLLASFRALLITITSKLAVIADSACGWIFLIKSLIQVGGFFKLVELHYNLHTPGNSRSTPGWEPICSKVPFQWRKYDAVPCRLPYIHLLASMFL